VLILEVEGGQGEAPLSSIIVLSRNRLSEDIIKASVELNTMPF
jgi:hypothetical protein